MRAGRLGRIGIMLLAAAGFAWGCSSGGGAADGEAAGPDAGAMNGGSGGTGGGWADAPGSATTDTGPAGGPQGSDVDGSSPVVPPDVAAPADIEEGPDSGPSEDDADTTGSASLPDIDTASDIEMATDVEQGDAGGSPTQADAGSTGPFDASPGPLDVGAPPDTAADASTSDAGSPPTVPDATQSGGDAEPGTASTAIPAPKLKNFAMQWTCPDGSAPPGLGAWVDFDPFLLHFVDVPAGKRRTQALLLHNRGDAPLVVDSAAIEGDSAFTFDGAEACGPLPCSEDGSLPVTVEPGGFTVLRVSFAPFDTAAHEGTLRISTNDPRRPDGLAIALVGNAQAPCIDIVPRSIEFGGVVPGTSAQVPIEIRDCGAWGTTISSVTLSGPGASAFSLQMAAQPGPLGQLDAVLTYTPPAAAALDADGLPVPDVANLVVEVEGLANAITVPVRGTGLAETCPAVQATVSKDIVEWNTEVQAQPALADGKPLPPGKSWKWRISPPTPAAPPASIDEATGTVEIPLTVAGAWSFAYALGEASCQPECVPSVATAIVRPAGNVAVELSWVTPADPDESDEGPDMGSDLDLHFLFADPVTMGPDVDGDGKPDGWYDTPFDCFWFNPNPDWGSLDPNIDDNPLLARDDTDGAGPETLRYSVPVEGATYRIGVHYWIDHGFGPAHAIVRMFLWGTVKRVAVRTLQDSDMWCAGTLSNWPEGIFGECEPPPVRHDYHNPFFSPSP